MEFKKCERCGCFFTSNNNICCNCAPKDTLEIATLKNYIEENCTISGNTVENLSNGTGISIKNINRYLARDDFAGFLDTLDSTKSTGNISINL